MRLPLGPGPGMTGVQVALVDELDRLRRKRALELGPDRVGDAHAALSRLRPLNK